MRSSIASLFGALPLLYFPSINAQEEWVERGFTVTGFVDTAACYTALSDASSIEPSPVLTRDEYAFFLQGMDFRGVLANLDTFESLPLGLQSNFNVLACLCTTPDCCEGDNAVIETEGTFPGDAVPSPDQMAYLFAVCLFTTNAIDHVVFSLAPSSTPSVTPSDSPTPAPTLSEVVTLVVTATYDIVVDGGDDPDIVTPQDELIAAMDRLAPQVLLGAGRRKLLRSGRRLEAIQLPTSIDETIAIDCPDGAFTSAQDRCETVTALITLLFQPGDANPEGTRSSFEDALADAIEAGDLQEALDSVNQDSVAFILTGASLGPSPRSGSGGSDDGLSGGGVAGIVIGAASAFVLVAIAMAMYARREEDKPDQDALAPAPRDLALDGDDEDATRPAGRDGSSAVLGATTPNYGKKHKATTNERIMDKDNDVEVSIGDHVHGDDSSNAGSSGWSSSAGVSSLNTGSNDGLEDPTVGIATGGATLAAIAGATAVRRTSSSEKSDTPSGSGISRSDLDDAIEANDWAAVGATAAMLAAASDSQSMSSRSGHFSGSVSRSGTSVSTLDAARAAELDHLVDAGDWEGVVLAAAKYEASEGPNSRTTDESGSDSNTGSGTYPSVSAASESVSQASSPSKARKREELRAQVEELVRRVVPEEIENVDEMMLQFRGREEELVETLRTMQERAVAQKARQGAQKAAKIDAKRSITEARSAPTSTLASASADSKSVDESEESPQYLPTNVQSLGAGQMKDKKPSAKPKATSLGVGRVEDATSDKAQKHSLLEQAIEAGDWEAVGEAAALMSDQSMTSADSSEINRLAEGLSSVTSSKSGSKGHTAQRAAELDKLVDKGDWAGVVAAASRYGQDDEEDTKPTKTKSWFGNGKQEQLKEQEEKRQKRLKRMQEEQDALEQAEIWMAIAEQTKHESEQEAPGAGDAADWAIAQSLSLLVKAEQEGKLQDSPKKRKDEEDDDEEEV